MGVDIDRYINSGVLEAYITGAATPAEEQEILHLRRQYPEVKAALQQLENDFEHMAQLMAIEPPPTTWNKIDDNINALIAREHSISRYINDRTHTHHNGTSEQQHAPKYIEVEAESNYIRVHKSWKWILATIFILGKIFLIGAIYFYLENRQAQQQLQELKQEIQVFKKIKAL